ncbi:MAG TPA: hypothetical protein VGV39_28895 [Mesorhizobium sp.]|jgi:hypothetical protein|uniref:hypothetical protein n=1 Tax=Mesorhizobium sp. TaxID=1871066 RepID=UPI002DDD7EC4|nr:hypothetical protein [Mesorhizobium sp.]HEV2507124.1 hypothetical protein [Mesorhizobium sp.]
MRFPLRIAALLAIVTIAAPAAAQVTDFLGVPGPLAFDGKSYQLAWTSRPSQNYTKQEYVPAGQRVESYDQMLLVELVTGGVTVGNAVGAQVDMLKKRKASDPLVNFDVLQNNATKEVLLDFILSGRDSKGEPIVEWNAYRYAPYKDASGKSGVLLFAISQRAYGDESSTAFLRSLKQLRPAQRAALAKADLPKPTR